MKIKRITVVVLLCIMFIVFGCVSNYPYYNSLFFENQQISLLDILNNTASGYTSIMAYCTIYLIPFLLSLNSFFLNENNIYIIRKNHRKNIYLERIKKVILMSLLMCSIHMLINFIIMLTFFQVNYLIERHFIFYSILNLIEICMFYTFVGLIFYIFIDFTRKFNLSLIITAGIFIGLFFIHKIIGVNLWTPLKDLVVLSHLLDNTITLIDVLIIYVRQFLIIILASHIGFSIFNERDFIKNEK